MSKLVQIWVNGCEPMPMECSIEIPQDVVDFVEVVAALNPTFRVYIGGGYLRDLFTNREPKDIDIFFVPRDHNYTYHRALGVPAGGYINYRRDSGDISTDLQERGVFEVTGIFMGKLSTSEVQYIVYGYGDIDGPYALAEDMDMNICQIAWEVGNSYAIVTDHFWKGHRDRFIECLHDYDKERMYHRYERMKAKYPCYEEVGKPGDEYKRPESKRIHAGSFRNVD